MLIFKRYRVVPKEPHPKYFRIVAHVVADGTDVSDALLRTGLAAGLFSSNFP